MAITFLSAYAPTAESKEKDKDKFYDELAAATEEKGSFLYFGGVFNASLYERQSHEQEEIREHIINKNKGIPGRGHLGQHKRQPRQIYGIP